MLTGSRPTLAVDVVLLTVRDRALEVLLTRRREEPWRDHWTLPGSLVRVDEPLDAAAHRALQDKAGLAGVYLEQLHTFGAVDRDPRARVVSVAHYALVDHGRAAAAAPAEDARWFSVAEIEALPMGFDHAEIVGHAVARIRARLEHVPIAFQLLPEAFTLSELQRVYEVILGRHLDKRNFRAKMLASGLLALAPGRRVAVGRPARLYRFLARGEMGLAFGERRSDRPTSKAMGSA